MSRKGGMRFLDLQVSPGSLRHKKQTRDPSLLNSEYLIGGLAPKPRDLVSDQGPLSGVMLRVGNGKTASKVVLGVNSIPIRCIFDVFITAALYSCPPLEASHHFFRVSFLRRVQANSSISSISSNSNKSNPPVSHKPSLTTGPSRPVVHLWSLDPFFRFAVTVLGEQKAKQISILPPERVKRTSKRPSVASFCVAKGTEPQQSQRVASYRCCSYFVHWCMCFFGATKERKKGFSLKKSCPR